MAYVKTRTTSSGLPSTALVESYRDAEGRPRQRVLANLRAMPDVLSALAKLAAQRERLRKEQEQIAPEVEQANQFYEIMTGSILAGRTHNAEQRKEIDRLLRLRNRTIKRADAIKAALATIQKDGAVIRKHCTANETEIQDAIRKHKKALEDVEAMAAFDIFSRADRKNEMRRLSIGPVEKSKFDAAVLKQMMRG